MRWQTDVRHSGSPQRSQANGINQQRMHIAARFAVALEWQPSAACVCPCVCVYSSVHLCRYKCICRLLWIANGIEEWRRDKRAGRQIEWEIYCIHSLTYLHTHTHMINCINYCMVTTFILFILIYLMRSCPGIVLIMPGNHFHCNCDKLWQHTHTRTHTYTDAGAWTRSSCRFLWAFIVLYKLLFSELFLRIMMIFNWRIRPELSAWSLSWALRLKADML